MRELIHNLEGIRGYRTDDGILIVGHYDCGKERRRQVHQAIKNAAEKLKIMNGCGFVPKVLKEKRDSILMEDLGQSDTLFDFTSDDWKDFNRLLVKALITLRQKNIRHSDLNGNNIIIKNKRPYFIDWWESHFIGEEPPGSSPFHDAYWLFSDIKRWIDNPALSDPNRLARRWGPIHGSLMTTFDCSLPLRNKTLLDVGCFQGDFSAWAAAEMMEVTGIDTGDFRSGEDSIEIARSLWDNVPNLRFVKANVMDWPDFRYDIILFMDTFSHLVKHLGRDEPTRILNKMVDEAGCVFFETQMWGDRTGVEWLKTSEDIFALVPGATFTEIVTAPEHGIDRTVWRIEK